MKFSRSYQLKSAVTYIQILMYCSTFIQTNVSQLQSFLDQYVQIGSMPRCILVYRYIYLIYIHSYESVYSRVYIRRILVYTYIHLICIHSHKCIYKRCIYKYEIYMHACLVHIRDFSTYIYECIFMRYIYISSIYTRTSVWI